MKERYPVHEVPYLPGRDISWKERGKAIFIYQTKASLSRIMSKNRNTHLRVLILLGGYPLEKRTTSDVFFVSDEDFSVNTYFQKGNARPRVAFLQGKDFEQKGVWELVILSDDEMKTLGWRDYFSGGGVF
jgi:hypothetical protein